MDLRQYVGCFVKIDVISGWYWEGKVISADENSLELLDKVGKRVSLVKQAITCIQEVRK